MENNQYMKNKRYIAMVLIVSLFFWLFIGIYQSREFNECHFFIKYRPTFKFYFYTPIGECDSFYLSPNDMREEAYYKEFVERKK